jgi:ribosomal protein L37AE/L43A
MATGAMRDTELPGLDNEPCPQCGDKDHTRWIDSDKQSDAWECAACGYEWAIPVTNLTGSPQQP